MSQRDKHLIITDDLSKDELKQMRAMTPSEDGGNCKIGKCCHCREIRNDLLLKMGKEYRCSDCDSRYQWCSICKEDQFDEDTCRHLFQCEYGEWMGSGAYMAKDSIEYIEECLRLLLDLMPQGFAQALRTGILSGRFHTWLVAPLIGGGGSLTLYGVPRRIGRRWGEDWGDCLIELGSGEHAEECADAYHWLASLYDHKTRVANRITLRILDRYIALERAARLHALPA